MEIKQLQQKVARSMMKYGEENRIRIDDSFILLKLFEETGELADAALVHANKCRKDKCLTREAAKENLSLALTDVAAIVLAFASNLNVDLEKSIKERWIKDQPEEE